MTETKPFKIQGRTKSTTLENVPVIARDNEAPEAYAPGDCDFVLRAMNSFDANEKRIAELKEVLASVTRELEETLNVTSRAIDQCHGNFQSRTTPSIKAIEAARAALGAK